MIRRSGGGRLRSGRRFEDDVNPMESMGNLSDAMLVLAVGMMLALVINWNVDINTSHVKEIKDPAVTDQQVTDEGDEQNLQEKGTVYVDPDTGKYYVKVD